MPDYTKDEMERLIARYTAEFERQYKPSDAATQEVRATDTPASVPAVNTRIPEQTDASELTDIGSLQVRVSTENQAIPIAGAVVTVTRNNNGNTELVRLMITDENGLTEILDLPTKDRRLSLSPDNPSPFAVYTVNVTADGYADKRFADLPIYGGVTAIQSVSMIPLPEASDSDLVLNYPSNNDTP